MSMPMVATLQLRRYWYAAGPRSCLAPAGLINAPSVSFDRPSPTGYTVPATVINDTHLTCTPPAVTVTGVAVLSVSLDNRTFSTPSASWPAPAAPTCLEYFSLFSSAVGRRPYFGEEDGSRIVSTHETLRGLAGLSVSASLDEPAVALLSHLELFKFNISTISCHCRSYFLI